MIVSWFINKWISLHCFSVFLDHVVHMCNLSKTDNINTWEWEVCRSYGRSKGCFSKKYLAETAEEIPIARPSSSWSFQVKELQSSWRFSSLRLLHFWIGDIFKAGNMQGNKDSRYSLLRCSCDAKTFYASHILLFIFQRVPTFVAL